MDYTNQMACLMFCSIFDVTSDEDGDKVERCDDQLELGSINLVHTSFEGELENLFVLYNTTFVHTSFEES